jgi:hypothetical protein
MPAIATGMVVLWEKAFPNTPNERIKYVSDKQVGLYVGDDSKEADATSILGEYILDVVTNLVDNAGAPATDPVKLQKAITLLKAARDGLLEVVDITRSPITPPSVR